MSLVTNTLALPTLYLPFIWGAGSGIFSTDDLCNDLQRDPAIWYLFGHATMMLLAQPVCAKNPRPSFPHPQVKGLVAPDYPAICRSIPFTVDLEKYWTNCLKFQEN